MKNAMDDSGMLKEDEGCCIEQVANFCKKEEKVTYYVINFEHKTFETNKDNVSKKNQNGLPRLKYVHITIYMK